MASATFASMTSLAAGVGASHVAKSYNASQQEVVTSSSARLPISGSAGSSPAASLRKSATFLPLRRTAVAKLSQKQQSAFHVICKSVSSEAVLDKEVEDEEEVAEEKGVSPPAPSALEVQSLLLDICDGTSIAELKLKVGDFQLHVKRDIGKVKAVAPAASAVAPTPAAPAQPKTAPLPAAGPVTTAAKTNNSASSSLIPATVSKTASLFGLLEAAADKGLTFVTSPKVGVFRRGRPAKGKNATPLIEEGMTIKQGQVVGYIEQFGTQQPVESQVSGEVTQMLWADGEPVGYGDPLMSILPSFPGIPKGALN